MTKPTSLDLELFCFLSYLAVSARGCIDEPKLYGPFRLVDGISRLIAILDRMNAADPDWIELKEFIDRRKFEVMQEGDFSSFLDEVVTRVVILLDKA